MADINVIPFIMKNAIVTLGSPGDDFAAACSSAGITPSGGTAEFKGLKKSAVFTFPTAATYTLDLEYAQDWHSDSSLSRWLWDHRGENVPFVLDPDDLGDGHTSWEGTVAITAGGIGGAVDAVATASVSLGIVGEPTPTLVPATP